MRDAREWNAFVGSTDDSTFCHLWEWRDIIGGVMGHRAEFLGVRDRDGALRGVLPIYHLRSPLFGHHVVSVPFLNYGGPIGASAARRTLATHVLARSSKAAVVLRTRQAVAADLPMATPKVTVVLPLPADADTLWQRSFDAKFRNKIKRPQRDGMVTRFGAEHIDAFYEIFAENMRDLGTPVLPRQFFQRIAEHMPSRILVGITTWNDRPVAGGFGFIWRDEFEMTWSSSLRELRAAKPNMLLYWDYMRELIARGVRRFNFGRSTPGSGPHDFKLSWGGVDEPLPWIQSTRGREGAGRVAQLASTIWRGLPVPVTKKFGPALARQLPWW